MKHLIGQSLYEYVSLPEEEQNVMAMTIIREWLSWDYKTVNQAKFLFLQRLFPELMQYTTMYRGIDVNYLKVYPENVHSFIWDTNNGKYASWCKEPEHTTHILKNMAAKTGWSYLTLIKQQNNGLSILDAIELLAQRGMESHPDWDFAGTKDYVEFGKISEIISPLARNFTIVGVYNIRDNYTYTMEEWKQVLPIIKAEKRGIYKWTK